MQLVGNIRDTLITNIQGDFEIIYATRNTGKSPERAAFSIASLQFSTSELPCNSADLALNYNVLDLSDINAFINGFTTQNPIVDLNGDLVLDLTDINEFISAFVGGCP